MAYFIPSSSFFVFRGCVKYSQNIFLLLQFGTFEMADETMLIQPPDNEHTSHTVTKMAADLSAYSDYIVDMTGVTSCLQVSLTRFHSVIALHCLNFDGFEFELNISASA